MIRLVLVDSNAAFCHAIEEEARQAGDIDVVAVAHDGEAGYRLIGEHAPHAVVLELFLPQVDGFGVLERLNTQGVRKRPKILVTTVAAHEHLLSQALSLGADYCVIKPFDIQTLLLRVRQLVRPESVGVGHDGAQQALLLEITRRLADLGVPPHFKGYQYLRDAISIVVQDSTMLNGVTKYLYPTIARRHGSSPQRVERAIRNAIEVTMTRGNLEEIQRVFGYSVDAGKGKPSNSSFIARLADQVRLDVRAG
ncbi:MAG: sporulation transcription factor Spo0A [Firmicutes bacterium ZCTH02-B6]|nr:MAG: sporulation transcription factor Spo0A [Firmicutes bacterium ZCTH02-B6]